MILLRIRWYFVNEIKEENFSIYFFVNSRFSKSAILKLGEVFIFLNKNCGPIKSST